MPRPGRLPIPAPGDAVSKLDESLLIGLPPFARLSRAEIREILDRASPKRYAEGTAVFREGAAADRHVVVLPAA